MRDVFALASRSVLRLLGKDALLRGVSAGKVNIEHGVEVYEQTGDHQAVFARSIATISKQYEPKQGDQLVMLDDQGAPAATYKLGRLFADNGHNVRYVVIEV